MAKETKNIMCKKCESASISFRDSIMALIITSILAILPMGDPKSKNERYNICRHRSWYLSKLYHLGWVKIYGECG